MFFGDIYIIGTHTPLLKINNKNLPHSRLCALFFRAATGIYEKKEISVAGHGRPWNLNFELRLPI